MTRARLFAPILAALLAACGSSGTEPQAGNGEEPAAFDLATVKANFRNECADPIVVDADFCKQVNIDAMTAEGTILNVPTGLNPAARDRARAICETFARAHFDGATGDDLGYRTIGIKDMDGGNAAACTVAP